MILITLHLPLIRFNTTGCFSDTYGWPIRLIIAKPDLWGGGGDGRLDDDYDTRMDVATNKFPQRREWSGTERAAHPTRPAGFVSVGVEEDEKKR